MKTHFKSVGAMICAVLGVLVVVAAAPERWLSPLR
jgi:hypothetical protein